MIHLQTIQTTNHVFPNMHKISKLQINQHKVKVFIRIPQQQNLGLMICLVDCNGEYTRIGI